MYKGHSTYLRGNSNEAAESLHKEVDQRLKITGVNAVEARLTHLAYATGIIRGIKEMVKEALIQLDDQGIVNLGNEKSSNGLQSLGSTTKRSSDYTSNGYNK